MYHVWITKVKVFNLHSLYIMCGSLPIEKVPNLQSTYMACASQKQNFQTCGVYISCVNHQRKCFKVGDSLYHLLITKENVLKLQSLYILFG